MAFASPISSSFRPSRPPSTMQQQVRCSTTPAKSSTLPPRVITTPTPNLYVYDHCPFCVRVRHLLGLKNVKYNLVWLANDDVETPSSMVGKKIVPIFQPIGSSGPAMAESLDICQAIDADPRFGPVSSIKAASPRTDVVAWMDTMAMPMRRLTRVRFSRAPLPEFVFTDAREAYVRNHPLKEPADYDENMANSTSYIAEIQERLDELANMIYCPQYCSEGGVSYDDIILFPRLRALTIIKGLSLPNKIKGYVEYQSRVAEIPLYDYCAM